MGSPGAAVLIEHDRLSEMGSEFNIGQESRAALLKVIVHTSVDVDIREVCVLFHYTIWSLHSDLIHIDLYDLNSDSTEIYFYTST